MGECQHSESMTKKFNGHFKPVICIGRQPTHYLITFSLYDTFISNDHSASTESISQLSHQSHASAAQQSQQQPPPPTKTHSEPRGSFHGSSTHRRSSIDVRSITSDNIRRSSVAKLSTLPLEAPFTKVIKV